MRRAMRYHLSSVILLLLAGASAATAADRTVGSGKTYANIQDAYTAASSGDTITVDDGTYAENGTGGLLLLNADKNITIRSASQTASGVVIKAASSTNSVILHSNGNVTLQNVTIDGTGLTSATFGALHSNASGDDLTCTGVVWQNVPVASTCFYNITGSNGTVTFTGCTIAGGFIGVQLHATTTAVIIDSSSITPAGTEDAVRVNTLSTIGTLTIRNGSVLTAPTRAALYVDKSVTTINITDSTLTGGTAANADAIHIHTGDTVTTLNISGSTVTARGASGTVGALEIGGTITTLKITASSTLAGGATGVGLLGYDGTNYGAGTWLKVRDSTITSGDQNAVYLQRAYNQIDFRDSTFTAGDSAAAVVVFGTDPADTDADNASPLGNIHFWGNTVTKTGASGHCALFGNGCGYGSVVGNTFTGGDWGLVVKGSRLFIQGNEVYTSAATPAMTLAGAQNCWAAGNTIVNGGGTGLHIGNDARTTTPPSALYNVVSNNIVQATGGVPLVTDAGEYDDCVLDYNLYYRTDSGNLGTISGTGCPDLAAIQARWLALYAAEGYGLNDAHSVSVDPLLVYPAGGVFAITSNSPAIGAAYGGGTLGAWQFPGYDYHWIDGAKRRGTRREN